jgi:GNAT superfamily N-acetyltransferase
MPPGGHVMDQFELLLLYDEDQRQNVVYPDTRREVLPHLVRHIDKRGAGQGTIIHSRLDEKTVDRAIQEQTDHFESIDQDFEWKVYDYDTPADLKDRLAHHGFDVDEAEAIMMLDMGHVPEILRRPATHRVKRITEPEDVGQVIEVEQAVWGESFAWLGRYLTEALTGQPDRMSVFIVCVRGQGASVGWTYYPPGSRFASLWGGSTLESFRGRGLYTTLLATRVQEARARKVQYLTVDANTMSQPILEKYGFTRIAEASACTWRVKARTEGAT